VRRTSRYAEDRPTRSRRDDKPTRSSRSYRDESGDSPRFKRTASPRRLTSDKPKKITKSTASKNKEEVRLNKFIANSGICSRREADEYITAGLVTVNGEVITELGTKVKPTDDIRFNGERMKGELKVYIVMNKPKDYVTTTSDPHAENTVMDLVGDKCHQRIFPIGRLDKNTTGVLLFTNDGELAEQLTHPSYNKKKVYHVFLDKNLKQTDLNQLVDGVRLSDGLAHVDVISYVDGDKSQVGLEIHSGRNRIVRRMFEHLGYKVKKLDRVYFAGITKKNLKRGQWRFLTENEVTMLKIGAYE
jgi:23S rRNA pseudouridine2605 synthase